MSDAALEFLNPIGLTQAVLDSMAEFADRVALHLWRIEQSPPVLGYEDFLIGRKHDPLGARILALNILRLGREGLEEIKAERKLASAINGVVRATDATPLVISRRAKLVVDALGTGWALSSLGKAFVSASIREDAYSFQALLGQAVAREANSCLRLSEVCAKLKPFLKSPRGLTPSRISMTHELLLYLYKELYSNSGTASDYPDVATSATRAAFKNELFDPRPAHRRHRSRAQGVGREKALR